MSVCCFHGGPSPVFCNNDSSRKKRTECRIRPTANNQREKKKREELERAKCREKEEKRMRVCVREKNRECSVELTHRGNISRK
jgi:hypothetical protein